MKSIYCRNCIGHTHFFAVKLILQRKFENKVQKQKRQMVPDRIWVIRINRFHLE